VSNHEVLVLGFWLAAKSSRKEKKMKKLITVCVVVLFAVSALPVQAAVNGQALGTAPPPLTLGSFNMTAFGPDPQPAGYTPVPSVASPLGGDVVFSTLLQHALTPSEWSTWSNGYNGDVYYSTDLSVTLTLPANTGAFYLYAEPQQFDVFQITATAQDGTFITQMVSGDSGACGYGFWGTGGSLISTIQIDCDDPTGCAVGEFGIALPEPATVCLLGLGALSFIRKKHAYA
jgi:hypothetical protein